MCKLYNETKKHCNCYCIKTLSWGGGGGGGITTKSAIHTCHRLYNSMPVIKYIDICYFLTLPTGRRKLMQSHMYVGEVKCARCGCIVSQSI